MNLMISLNEYVKGRSGGGGLAKKNEHFYINIYYVYINIIIHIIHLTQLDN